LLFFKQKILKFTRFSNIFLIIFSFISLDFWLFLFWQETFSTKNVYIFLLNHFYLFESRIEQIKKIYEQVLRDSTMKNLVLYLNDKSVPKCNNKYLKQTSKINKQNKLMFCINLCLFFIYLFVVWFRLNVNILFQIESKERLKHFVYS
jgi:hypothetical protein